MLLLGLVGVFSQNEMTQRGSIPEELLRPRKEESPRYPIDTVIGALGQGEAPQEAYETAKKIASALLAGNTNALSLSSVNKVFLENCMAMLDTVSPRSFRLGSGREEPDGSVSFLIRFIGREQGITGELYVRLEEPRSPPRPEAPSAAVEEAPEADDEEAVKEDAAYSTDAEDASAEYASAEYAEEITDGQAGQIAEPEQIPVPPISASAPLVWLFEDLILEEPRSREAENSETRHRFDFPPYERFF